MRQRGFTLLEVMISVAVLSLVVVSLMSTQTASLRLAGSHRDQTLAADLARAQLAEALVIPADELSPSSADGEGPYRRYRWSRTLHRTSTPGLTRVRIEVRCGDAEERAVVVETLVAPDEVEY